MVPGLLHPRLPLPAPPSCAWTRLAPRKACHSGGAQPTPHLLADPCSLLGAAGLRTGGRCVFRRVDAGESPHAGLGCSLGAARAEDSEEPGTGSVAAYLARRLLTPAGRARPGDGQREPATVRGREPSRPPLTDLRRGPLIVLTPRRAGLPLRPCSLAQLRLPRAVVPAVTQWTHMHTDTQTHSRTETHAHGHTQTLTCTWTHIHRHTHTQTHTHTDTCTHTHMHMDAHSHTHAHRHGHVHSHSHTDTD